MDIGLVHPKYQILQPGEEIRIECHSITPVKWLKNGVNFDAVTQLYTLIILNINKEDGGKYQCQGHFDQNEKYTAFTATAYVLVAGLFKHITNGIKRNL